MCKSTVDTSTMECKCNEGANPAAFAGYQFEYCHGDDGRAYYVKGHVPLDTFMTELRKEVDEGDPILLETPEHCWMRVCRDFNEGHSILAEAKTGSRGSFKCTWIQDN